MPDNSNAQVYKVCSHLLAQHRIIHLYSVLLSVGSGLLLFVLVLTQSITLAPLIVLLVVCVLGLLETRLAVRLGFDAALFGDLSMQIALDENASLQRLDETLVRLGLIKNVSEVREAQSRLNGALRLFRHQIVVLVLQVAVFLVSAIMFFLVN